MSKIEILIISEDTSIKNLMRLAGFFKVYEAKSEEEALNLLKKIKINVIICDYRFLNGKCLTILERIKRIPEFTFLLFIILIDPSRKDLIPYFAECGVDKILEMPLSSEILRKTILNEVERRLDKNSPEYHYLLGKRYLLLNEYELAFNEFYKAIELDKDFVKPYAEIARILLKNGKIKNAEELVKRALDINPLFIEGNHLLGEIYFIQNRYDLALKFFKKAFKLNPENENRNLKIVKICLLLDKKEELYEVIEFLDVDKILPIFDKYEKLELLENILNDLIEKKPYNLKNYLSLAELLKKKREFGKALAILNNALNIFENNPIIFRKIGEIYIEKGDEKEAKKYFALST